MANPHRLNLLLRRLAALLAIGVVHLFLIWNGDILAEYAVAGFIVLPFLYGARWIAAAAPPKVAGTVKGGKQPSGLSISPSGNMALVANREDKSISVLSINGTDVKVTDTMAMGDSVAHVAIAPDGKRALAVKFPAHKPRCSTSAPTAR